MPLLHATPKWGQEKGKGKGGDRQGIARERSRSRNAPVTTRSAAEVHDEDDHEDEHVDYSAGNHFRPSVVPIEIIQACDRLPIGTTRLTKEFADGGVKTILITVTEWPPEDL